MLSSLRVPGNPEYLFVYGTLRRSFNSASGRILISCADFMGNATFQGKLFKIDDYPGVVPSDKPSDLVHGEVYRLKNPGTVLAELDRYEECGFGFKQPSEYLRQIHSVHLQGGGSVHAWVYVYNWPRVCKNVMV